MDKNRDPLGNGRDLLLAVVVGFFGLFAIILGLWKITSDIGKPFQEVADANNNYEISGDAAKLAQENAQKAKQDTDGDGINDYEEEFIYGTSAYLGDTDSDGTADKAEIDAGENPLCAKGATCTSTYTTLNSDTSADVEDDTPPTAAEIRELLKENTDLSEETLAKFTDEELLALYEDTVKEVGDPFTKTTTGSPVNAVTGYEDMEEPNLLLLPGTNTAITSIDQIKNLSSAEIHSFLLALGLTESDFAGVSDDVLKGLLVELISSQLGQTTQGATNSNTNTNSGS